MREVERACELHETVEAQKNVVHVCSHSTQPPRSKGWLDGHGKYEHNLLPTDCRHYGKCSRRGRVGRCKDKDIGRPRREARLDPCQLSSYIKFGLKRDNLDYDAIAASDCALACTIPHPSARLRPKLISATRTPPRATHLVRDLKSSIVSENVQSGSVALP